MHATTDYAESVLAGEIVTGQKVKWACQRHIDDLKRDDIYFDKQAANRMINFYKLTPHVRGEWAGDPIVLEGWQEFIIGCLFGWKRNDGTRKYNEGYIQVARKNGKSTLLAPVGIYGMKYDDEPGANVYSAATTRDQAKEIFEPAKRMVMKSNYLDEIEIYKNNLSDFQTFSKFEPLSSDYDTLDGKNVHIALIDELHAHPDSGIWDVLADGTGSRRNPLILAITTAGFNQESFCYKFRNYCLDILNPKKPDFKDDKLFAYIAELDDNDDWQDSENWIKANPNINVSVKKSNIESRIKKAKHMPSQRNRIICKRLNIWTNADSRWFDMDIWDKSAGGDLNDLKEIMEMLEGQECYGALDLSSKVDLTCWLKLFPINNKLIIIPEFFVPKENIELRSKQDNVPYDVWARKGLINATEGNVVHYAAIEQMIINDYKNYNIKRISHDRWGATQMAQNLDDAGINITPMGQGYKSMSEPMKEVEKLVLEQKLNHFNHPVLRWNIDNTVAKTDPAGNIKPDKGKSKEKIDGTVALVMAIDGWIRQEGEGKSIYEDRGIRTL